MITLSETAFWLAIGLSAAVGGISASLVLLWLQARAWRRFP